MKPVNFKYANVVFAENQPEYQPLPAHRSEDGTVTSCWRLSIIDRIRALFVGRVYFSVLTFSTPLQPQLPTTYNPVKRSKEGGNENH